MGGPQSLRHERSGSVTQINKAVNFVLMLVAGSVFNIITGNVILTSIGTFVLGYLLNRGGKPSKSNPSTPPLTQAPVRPRRSQAIRTVQPDGTQRTLRCRNCGGAISSNQKFCRRCGSRTPSTTARRESRTSKYNPEYIRAKLEEMGDRDETTYQNLVEDLVLIDDWGRYWSIGSQTSKWYIYENGSWIPDQPTGMLRMKRRTGALTEYDLTALGLRQTTSQAASRATCPACNSRINPSQKFCKRCGHRLVT